MIQVRFLSGLPGNVATRKAGLGDAMSGDLHRRSWEAPGTESYRKGKFDVVVTPTHVYLYKDGLVTISYERKTGIPSKSPGEIK